MMEKKHTNWRTEQIGWINGWRRSSVRAEAGLQWITKGTPSKPLRSTRSRRRRPTRRQTEAGDLDAKAQFTDKRNHPPPCPPLLATTDHSHLRQPPEPEHHPHRKFGRRAHGASRRRRAIPLQIPLPCAPPPRAPTATFCAIVPVETTAAAEARSLITWRLRSRRRPGSGRRARRGRGRRRRRGSGAGRSGNGCRTPYPNRIA